MKSENIQEQGDLLARKNSSSYWKKQLEDPFYLVDQAPKKIEPIWVPLYGQEFTGIHCFRVVQRLL